MKEILDFLQTIYPVRLDAKKIPVSLKGPFDKAVARFERPEELKKLDSLQLGICEEVADLTYQVLKLICLENNILTEETIRILQDYLEKNHYYDGDGILVGLDYQGLDQLSISLVPAELVMKTRALLIPQMFVSSKDNGRGIIRDFLGGQFVAYISRIWRGHAMGGLQAAEHMKEKKIPEETVELIEALAKSSFNLTGDELIKEEKLYLFLASTLFIVVHSGLVSGGYRPLLKHLALILEKKMPKPLTVEDTLHLMFLKMKGRQELDFNGVPEQEMRYICKPVEYLIEADMFF